MTGINPSIDLTRFRRGWRQAAVWFVAPFPWGDLGFLFTLFLIKIRLMACALFSPLHPGMVGK
jgi:hypothetical protein